MREGEKDLASEREREIERVRVFSHPTTFPLPRLQNRKIILIQFGQCRRKIMTLFVMGLKEDFWSNE